MQNQSKLEDLYKQYARTLYFYLLKLSGSAPIAEDLTQETFVRATISLHKYEGEEARAWLFKVARNAYLDEWRKQKRWHSISFLSFISAKNEMISPYGIPEDSLLKKEQSRKLEDLFHFLPERYRSILYLREFEEFSYREIMEALQLTEEQVKVTLYRARKRLSSLAKKKGWEYDGME